MGVDSYGFRDNNEATAVAWLRRWDSLCYRREQTSAASLKLMLTQVTSRERK